MKEQHCLLKLSEISVDDIAIVGKKNAFLAGMMNDLHHFGVNIPDGFVLTNEALIDFLAYNGIESFITSVLERVKTTGKNQLKELSEEITAKIQEGVFPYVLRKKIEIYYTELSKENEEVAVRASFTASDLSILSFPGQEDTLLNISGIEDLLQAIKACFAALYTEKNILHICGDGPIHLSVCIQNMVRSDIGSSGVAYSLDKESGFKEVIAINSTFGLGKSLVQGAVSPDEFLVFKTTLKKGLNAIIEKKLGDKPQKMVYGKTTSKSVELVKTTTKEARSYSLSDQNINQLAKYILTIEDYFSTLNGSYCPVEVEWALDGQSGALFILQAKPEKHFLNRDSRVVNYALVKSEKHKVLLKGIAVGGEIGYGKIVVLDSKEEDISHIKFNLGDILLADLVKPDWEPLIKKAAAIIMEKGGKTCHAAIMARELNIPTIVGCSGARDILKSGQNVTVSCAEGDIALVYDGILEIQKSELNIEDLTEIVTPVMLNVGSPDIAFRYANLPHQGIGLARLEFIINNSIKIHPLALLNKNSLQDEKLKQEIESLVRNHKTAESYFIDKLSYGIAKIAASCYPKKVIVRFSDFKSNEYASLAGGKYFEPQEENPMIGWRGASRYYSEAYKDAFGLECKAIKNVRDNFGLDNIIVMIPFCRTVDELKKVYSVMAKNGLKRGKNDLQVYLMAELPSNFIMAEEFADHVDGFSIGSNDLTQLVLGLDRDSSQVGYLYDERNYAIKKMIRMLLDATEDKEIKIGICGQAPSNFPDFAQFLVKEGIDSISVSPDAFATTIEAIDEVEKKFRKKAFTVAHNMGAFRLQ